MNNLIISLACGAIFVICACVCGIHTAIFVCIVLPALILLLLISYIAVKDGNIVSNSNEKLLYEVEKEMKSAEYYALKTEYLRRYIQQNKFSNSSELKVEFEDNNMKDIM